MELLLCTVALPDGCGPCNFRNTLPHHMGTVGKNSCYILPHCLGATHRHPTNGIVGSRIPTTHRCTSYG